MVPADRDFRKGRASQGLRGTASLSKDDVKVELNKEGLTISDERKREQEDRREGIYRSERSYGSFRRTIPIPDEAQVEKAKATFEHGILTVSVPVPESKHRRQEIPIESGSGQSHGPSSTERGSATSKGTPTKRRKEALGTRYPAYNHCVLLLLSCRF